MRPLNSAQSVLAAALAAGLAAAAPPARGLQADAGQAQGIEEIVVIGRRVPTTLGELASPAALVSGARLDELDARHIKEALNRMAGVNVQRGNGQEYLPAVRSPVLTGAGGCGGLMTAQDGVPLRAAGFCNLNELFEAHSEQAERLELWRGPGPVYYGGNAVHGIVNVASPRVDGRRLAVAVGEHGWGRIRAGWGDGARTTALSLTADGGWRHDSAVRQAKMSARRPLGGGDEVIVNAAHLQQDSAGFVEGLGAYEDLQRARGGSATGAFRNATSVRAQAEFGGGGWRLVPYMRAARMRFLQHFLPGTPVEYNRHASLGVQSSRSGGGWHYGLDGEYTDGALRQSQEGETEGSAFVRATVPQGAHYDYAVRGLMLAAFAERRWQSGPLAASLGARLEYQGYDYDNLMLDGRTRDDGSECDLGGCRYSRPADRSDDFLNLSPRLGLVWRMPSGGRWYAALSHGFRAPQATELYRLQREQSVAELRSEEALGVDAGWRGASAAGDWRLGAWWMRKRDIIFRDDDFFNRSGGASRHSGMEAELRLGLARRWRLETALSWSLHSDADSGRQLQGAPRLLASVRLLWDGAAASWELHGEHRGGYLLDEAGAHSHPGHSLAHLTAAWAVGGGWQMTLQAHNLLDARYAERADYVTFGGGFYRYLPGAPRTLRLGLRRSQRGPL